MAAHAGPVPSPSDGIESLERLKEVETDADLRVRALRGKIDQTLSQLREDSEAQILSARQRADEAAAAQLEKALVQADTEAARVLEQARAELGQEKAAGPEDIKPVWNDILSVLFGEFS